MSVLLFIVGAILTVLGIGMAGYGIPINEFSFGNTLIVAGTTTTVGGLILIGLAATIRQLKRIAETLAERAPADSGRSLDLFEPLPGVSSAPMPDRVPFPPRPKAADKHEPKPAKDASPAVEMPAEGRSEAPVAPTLPNPDVPAVAVTEYDAVSLSPQQPIIASASAYRGEPAAAPVAEKHTEPTFDDPPWRFPPPAASPPPERQAQTRYFDAMWPAESRPARSPLVDESKPEPKFDEPQSERLPPVAAAQQAPEPPPVSAPPVAILKSGVVDGMGYTLYVDGSIEAELPQGTLHFASINELREHLAKSS